MSHPIYYHIGSIWRALQGTWFRGFDWLRFLFILLIIGTEACYIAQADLEFRIISSQSLKSQRWIIVLSHYTQLHCLLFVLCFVFILASRIFFLQYYKLIPGHSTCSVNMLQLSSILSPIRILYMEDVITNLVDNSRQSAANYMVLQDW